jgi:hypothetical protein
MLAARFLSSAYNEVTARRANVILSWLQKLKRTLLSETRKKYIVASMLRQIGEFFNQPSSRQL